MRLLLDACVLYPVATREIVLAWAGAGGFTPLWSPRILEEWALSVGAKQGPEAEARARGDIALMRARWPESEVAPQGEGPAGLPDKADGHVIAAAMAGRADAILTFNLRDFPRRALAPLGLSAFHPDAWLAGELAAEPARLRAALDPLAAAAEARGAPFRRFLRRAGLPRAGKAWERITAL